MCTRIICTRIHLHPAGLLPFGPQDPLLLLEELEVLPSCVSLTRYVVPSVTLVLCKSTEIPNIFLKVEPMNWLAGQEERHRHREQTSDTVGEGEGGMNREGSTETYTAMGKQPASGKGLHGTRGSARCPVTPQRRGLRWARGQFRREGAHGGLWLTYTVCGSGGALRQLSSNKY